MPLISWIHLPTPSHVVSRISWVIPAVARVEPTNAPSSWPTPPSNARPT